MKYLLGTAVCLMVLFLWSCNDGTPIFPVQYRITFTPLWTVNTFPVDYPTDASFTPFISYSHKVNSDLPFYVGQTAQDDIKDLAETGLTTKLLEYIDGLRGSGQALDRAIGDKVAYPTVSEVIIGFDDAHTQCSVYSKINPSPDWYIAATEVNLKNGGNWVDSITVTPVAYDAGTDQGNTFNATPNPVYPPLPIKVIITAPLAYNGVVPPLVRIGFKKVK